MLYYWPDYILLFFCFVVSVYVVYRILKWIFFRRESTSNHPLDRETTIPRDVESSDPASAYSPIVYSDEAEVKSALSSLGYDVDILSAIDAVFEAGSCTTSMLQRNVKIGYSRAARIVDQLEDLGIVGSYEGANPRCVIMDRDSWIDFCNRSLHELTPARTYSDSSDGEIFSISPEEAQLIKDFRRLPKRDQEFIRQAITMVKQPDDEKNPTLSDLENAD